MNDSSKTKKDLIKESALLRQRIEEAERLESGYRQTKEALRDVETQLSAIYEYSSDVIYILDSDFKAISISNSVERYLGYRVDELIGKPFQELNILAPESLEAALKDTLEVLSGGTVPAVEYAFIRKDGSRIIAEVSGAPLMKEGKVIGVISVARDVTDRKLIEERLRESEKKYREMYDFLPIPVYEMDFEANMTSANRAVYETFRGTEEDLKKGVSAWKNLSPEDIEKSRRNIERLLQGEQPEATEYTLTRLDGSSFPAIAISSLIYRDGNPVGVRGAIVDITDRKEAEKKLRESEEKYRLLFDSAGDAIFVVDMKARMLAVNPLACKRLGYTHTEMISMTIDQVDSQEEALHVLDRMTRLMEKGQLTFETVHQRKDGSLIPTDVIARRITWDGKPAIMSICRDVTDRKEAEEKLRKSEAEKRLERDRLELILKTAQDGFWLVDASAGRLVDVNEAACSMLGYTREELLKLKLTDLDAQWSPEELGQQTQKVKATGNAFFETRQRTKSGRIIDVEVSVNYLPGTGQFFSFIRDITDRKQAEEKIQQMAYHDSLTGLPKRKLFSDRLAIALAHAQRNKKGVGIAMLDLDNFKDVNDTLDHDVGDRLLKAAAERLSAVLRRGDTVARIGGDEFMLIFPDLESAEDAIQVAQKIVDNFREPFPIGTHQLVVTTSIGIAIYPNNGIEEGALLKNADIAMYQAKQAGRDRYQLSNKV